jgi:hypothetical protein
MAMWAGVQKVSRPMERCQETSQCAPMVTEVTASAAHQRYQGMVLGFAVARGLVWLVVWAAVAMGTSVGTGYRVQGTGYRQR